MGCVFCATGQMGFKRHLTSGEIVAQVLYYARLLSQENLQVTNIVIMGMGEPFHNYTNTLTAIDRLNDPEGYNFGARRFYDIPHPAWHRRSVGLLTKGVKSTLPYPFMPWMTRCGQA